MPFYNYTCPKCNTNEQRLVKANDSTSQDCTKCATRLDRHFPTPNLKGKIEVDSKGRIWYGTGGASNNLTKSD